MNFKQFLFEQQWYQSTGTLRYSGNDKLNLEIDGGIAQYYLKMIPKWIDKQPQAYRPHITVVRGFGIEIPTNRDAWGKYEGEEVPFEYEGHVYYKEPYFYLKVNSKRLEEIRQELGLPRTREKYMGFHVTIANSKGL